MYKAKKALSLALGFAFSLSLLTGCGKSDNAASTDTSSAVSASQTAAASSVAEASKSNLEHVELNWYVIGKPQKDTELVEDEVEKYLKDSLNCRVNINYFDWGAY